MHQLQTVLDALESLQRYDGTLTGTQVTEALAIIRQMMQAEPVAWKEKKTGAVSATIRDERLWTPLYTYPAPQEVPAKKCKYSDPLCPCQDGHQCHYEGKDAWTEANLSMKL